MVRLTDEQYAALASEACEYYDGLPATVAADLGYDRFRVTFTLDIRGHSEWGTDGFTVTSAVCRVSDYDEAVWADAGDEEMQPVEFDPDRFERMVEDMLLTE